MDQYATRKTAMQDDIDTLKAKMDQLMEMLTAQHVREEERATTAAAAAPAVAAAVATANNASNNAAVVVPPVVTENMRTLRGDTPFPRVQAPNPPLYGMPFDFVNGAENQGNASASHVANQAMGNDERRQEEDEQGHLWSTTPQGEEDQQDDYMRQFYQNVEPA